MYPPELGRKYLYAKDFVRVKVTSQELYPCEFCEHVLQKLHIEIGRGQIHFAYLSHASTVMNHMQLI